MEAPVVAWWGDGERNVTNTINFNTFPVLIKTNTIFFNWKFALKFYGPGNWFFQEDMVGSFY